MDRVLMKEKRKAKNMSVPLLVPGKRTSNFKLEVRHKPLVGRGVQDLRGAQKFRPLLIAPRVCGRRTGPHVYPPGQATAVAALSVGAGGEAVLLQVM